MHHGRSVVLAVAQYKICHKDCSSEKRHDMSRIAYRESVSCDAEILQPRQPRQNGGDVDKKAGEYLRWLETIPENYGRVDEAVCLLTMEKTYVIVKNNVATAKVPNDAE